MASSAPQSALRQLFEQHFTEISGEMERLLAESQERGERSRREFADSLNQAVRRIRQAADRDEVGATLVDAASAFATAAAWFRVADGKARGRRIRGVPEAAAETFASLEIPLAGNSSEPAALAGAIETRDPVIAAISPSQVSETLMNFPGHPAEGRVAIFPLAAKDGVPGLLYCWGEAQIPVLELLTQVAAAAWDLLKPPVAELVRIEPIPAAHPLAPASASAPASPAPATAAPSAWERLSAEEQQIHLRAQRFARVQTAEMRLHAAVAVESGRARGNLYEALREPIDAARATFHHRFFVPCASMVDYLHLELLRTLANDNAELLGKDYPGPLV